MKSITKRDLDHLHIQELVKNGFGNHVKVTSIQELKDGYFNNSYVIVLLNGKKVVLKVAPCDEVQVLTYEKDLMSTEVSVLQLFYEAGILVPEVFFYDRARNVLNGEYFFMDHLEGIPMNKVKEQMTEEQKKSFFTTLGKNMKIARGLENDYFGSISDKSKRFTSWYACFHSMIMDLMEDAYKVDMDLPISKQEASVLVDGYKGILDTVTSPTLVHKDLWEGNIFVDYMNFQLVGIIDCERAIYADPLMEAVCGFLDENEEFMSTYYGTVDLNENERTRLNLYKLYLFLLMVVECPYRKYDDEGFEKWAREMLQSVLHKLKAPATRTQ